jgi:hypothetical protein
MGASKKSEDVQSEVCFPGPVAVLVLRMSVWFPAEGVVGRGGRLGGLDVGRLEKMGRGYERRRRPRIVTSGRGKRAGAVRGRRGGNNDSLNDNEETRREQEGMAPLVLAADKVSGQAGPLR